MDALPLRTMQLFTAQLCFIFLSLLSWKVQAQVPIAHEDTRPSGEYVVYLNAQLLPTSAVRACYFTYAFQYKGKDVWSSKASWRKKGRLVTSGASVPEEGKPQPLQGTFKWFSKNGKVLLAEESFLNGRESGETRIYSSQGKLERVYDYSRKWELKQWSFYLETYERGNLMKSGFMFFNEANGVWENICTQGCYITKDFR